MKRIFIFLLTLALAFGLVACGGDSTPDVPDNRGGITVTVCSPTGAAIPGVFVFVYDGAGNATGYANLDIAAVLGKGEGSVFTADPHAVGWTHSTATIAYRNREDTVHTVEIRRNPETPD